MEWKSTIVRTGLYSYAGIALLFVVMKVFGLEEQTWMRFLNILFIIYFTNSLAKQQHKSGVGSDYLRAWGGLILANVITVSLSLISFVVYVVFIDPNFMKTFVGGILWNNTISLEQAALTLFTEGIGTAVAISFIIMQYWNDPVKVKPLNK